MKKSVTLVAVAVMSGIVAPLGAQAPPRPDSPQTAALRDRYQIGLMEGILQRAAEHGAKMTRDRARSVVPGDMLLSDDVRVRGIRLSESAHKLAPHLFRQCHHDRCIGPCRG